MSYERKLAPDQPAANDPKYVVIELRARIAALEAIVGKQEEELHQGELRVAELEAKLKWAMGLNACIEHERAEQAETELAALKGRRCGDCIHTLDVACEVSDAGWRVFGVAPFSCACWQDRAEEGGGS